MTPFLWYQLKAGVCIMLFTGLYYVLFRKETFHRFNRFYLLGSIMLSATIPVIRVTPITVNSTTTFSNLLQEVTVYAGGAQVDIPLPQPVPVFMQVYTGICIALLVYLLYQLIMLIALIIRRGFIAYGSYRLVVIPGNKLSFSFFNLIFLDATEAREGAGNPVLQHELAHARQGHSLDIMLVQIIKIFQWFNPFVYLMEKALKETHEYLADEAVLEHDVRSDRYRMLLLTQVFGVQPGIFSFFNYSLIKKRLIMMTKEKSPLRNRLKYLAVLPLVLLLGLVMCCSLNKTDDQSQELFGLETSGDHWPKDTVLTVNGDSFTISVEKKANAKEINAGIDPKKLTDEDPVFVFVDEQAKFQGGSLETFRDWVQKNLKYPEEAVKQGIFGRVTVQFTVNSKGEVCDVKILRGVHKLLDVETIRVIESSPEWIPGRYDGVEVKQQFVMPVIFQMQ